MLCPVVNSETSRNVFKVADRRPGQSSLGSLGSVAAGLAGHTAHMGWIQPGSTASSEHLSR